MFLFFSLYKLRKIAQYVNNYKLIYLKYRLQIESRSIANIKKSNKNEVNFIFFVR